MPKRKEAPSSESSGQEEESNSSNSDSDIPSARKPSAYSLLKALALRNLALGSGKGQSSLCSAAEAESNLGYKNQKNQSSSSGSSSASHVPTKKRKPSSSKRVVLGGARDLGFPPDASISVGAQYDYKLMPDYSGKLFALNKARLLQPNWHKIDGELIVPVKSMPWASTPPLGTPKIHSYCNLTLIVLSRYTYPLVLVPPYCLLLYPAGTTRIAPNS
ncbi:hypothetical protein F5051DRAFT_447415 [Lentinula edodes]|nr:hypothetical protein F5051DRAFT_447415 [Lentinula edodes]